MSKSKFQKHQQPLNTLQSMINGVLIETGKALRGANQKGAKTIGHTHTGLQASIPATINSFHLALDELEIDIVRAKAVLGRDLRELQARRNQLESPKTQQVDMADSLADEGELRIDSLSNAVTAAEPEPNIDAHDLIIEKEIVTDNPDPMSISSPKAEFKTDPGSPSLILQPHAEDEAQEPISKSIEAQPGNVQAMNDEPSDARDPIEHDADHGLGISMSEAVPSATSEAPADGGLQSATFDELFDGNNGESHLNFDDFNFSGDASGNHNADFGGNEGEFDLSSFGNQPNNDNGDPNSILHSLENFGDGSGEDFNLLDMSNNGADNQGAGDNAGDDYGMSGGDIDMALGESTFDDLLEGMDFGDADDGTGGGMMEHGEFDDEYFGVNNDG